MSLWRQVSFFAFFRDVVVCAAIAIGLGFWAATLAGEGEWAKTPMARIPR